ncbi:MAG: nicotinate-nucleotide--dimethylbenzimidazole phosphoribosyltransferase [Bacteroidales bacterium]|nr:nicotinate-nucleotide--dimethylbenzimidazole phosphoribosyltransferase [Bacteroidales bacterium]
MLTNIKALGEDLKQELIHKIDNKAKPIGSLGKLEKLAVQVGQIQQTLNPELKKPVMLTIAADHGITAEGVSPCPVEITWQQCLNFLRGGGGVNMFSQLFNFDFYVVDAGVNFDFEPHERLIDAKIRKGSRNFLHEPAMTREECLSALEKGREIVNGFADKGSNVIGFGEMGIGNTSPASILLSIFADLPIDKCTGPGAGLDDKGVANKVDVLKRSIEKHGVSEDPIEILATYGGLEIAMIAGGMIAAAEKQMIVLVDGFIATSALIAAHAINPNVTDYCIFSHHSKEWAHTKMLEHLGGEAVLNLELRLGEGTGAALAYPIVQAAVKFLNDMCSFEDARVHNTTYIDSIAVKEAGI